MSVVNFTVMIGSLLSGAPAILPREFSFMPPKPIWAPKYYAVGCQPLSYLAVRNERRGRSYAEAERLAGNLLRSVPFVTSLHCVTADPAERALYVGGGNGQIFEISLVGLCPVLVCCITPFVCSNFIVVASLYNSILISQRRYCNTSACRILHLFFNRPVARNNMDANLQMYIISFTFQMKVGCTIWKKMA